MGDSMSGEMGQREQEVLDTLTQVKESSSSWEESSDVTDYDWNKPCVFTLDEVGRFETFVDELGKKLADCLRALTNDEIQFSSVQFEQEYARRILGTDDQTATYYAPLIADSNEVRGVLMIPSEQATSWVAKVLGGSAGTQQELSSLECAILADLFHKLIEAFNQVFVSAGGRTLRCADDISTEVNIPFSDDQECVVTEFQIEEKTVIRIPLLVSLLVPVVGAETPSAGDTTNEQARNAIISALGPVELHPEVLLGTSQMSMRDIMFLEEGDVVLTGTSIVQPLEVTLDGETIMFGHLVHCEESYGLQISSWCSPKTKVPDQGNRSD